MPHILLVEDSPTQAQYAQLILESEGFTVDTAANGRAAIERLSDGTFDLILSDVLMPDLSGYELCRAVKTEPRTRHIPVVLLTQLTDPMDILRGLECGADNFITKPFEAAYLIRRIRSILANRSSHGPDAQEPGTILSFRGTGVTITTDKEQMLDLLLATVEDYVRTRDKERTAREAQAALEARAAELAETGRRKDQHLAMLAHELRNPLAPLLTSLHVLRQAGADARTREQSLDRMERQVLFLSRLLDDLLDASRVAQGKLALRLELVDLARLLRQAADDRRCLLERAGLSLTVRTPDTPVWHRGDPTRLSQVFHNLLDNAAKFTGNKGRVTVELTMAGQQAVATVADTGPGIAPEVLARLFQPFAQGEQSLDRPQGGLGLGLSVVRGLVEMHGGNVEAESAGPGQGAKFTVRLPLESEPYALAKEADSDSTFQPKRDKLRVVVIEDNRDAADSLCMLLRLMGHEVRAAYNGPDGVAAAVEFAPDAVISDIGLPGLDGFGVARQLRLNPVTARVYLLALTGYSSDEDRRLSVQAGFDRYLTKPVAPEILLELLAAPGK